MGQSLKNTALVLLVLTLVFWLAIVPMASFVIADGLGTRVLVLLGQRPFWNETLIAFVAWVVSWPVILLILGGFSWVWRRLTGETNTLE